MRCPLFLLIILVSFICMTIIVPVCADESADSTTTTTHVRTWQNPGRRLWEQKHRVIFDADEFMADGDRAKQGGDYPDALGSYNTAIDKIQKSTILSDAEKNKKLAEIYQHKAELYRVRQEPGDAALAARADEKAQSYIGKGTYSGPCPVYLTYYLTPVAGTVQLVQEFRDGSVMKSYTGSRFMEGFNTWYHAISPSASGYIDHHPFAKTILRFDLAPLLAIVLISQGVFSLLSFHAELAATGALIAGGVLYGLIYIFPYAAFGMLLAGHGGRRGRIARHLLLFSVAGGLIMTALVTGLVFTLDGLTVLSSNLLVLYCMLVSAWVSSCVFCGYLVESPCHEKVPLSTNYPAQIPQGISE